MDNAILVLQILMWILCPAVIGLILLQGAAGDLTSSFGGGGQLDASLGVGAHRKMAQVTGVLAVVFFVIVLVLAYPHRKSFRDMKNAEPVPAAAAPAPTVPAAAAPVVAPAAPAAPAVTPTPVAETPAAAAPVAPAPAPAPAPAVEPAAVTPAATPAPAQPEAPAPAKP